jgi:hypothetical protein
LKEIHLILLHFVVSSLFEEVSVLPALFWMNGNTCEYVQVGFMKTHKTASSTLQNILMRYGREHGWNFVMMKVSLY